MQKLTISLSDIVTSLYYTSTNTSEKRTLLDLNTAYKVALDNLTHYCAKLKAEHLLQQPSQHHPYCMDINQKITFTILSPNKIEPAKFCQDDSITNSELIAYEEIIFDKPRLLNYLHETIKTYMSKYYYPSMYDKITMIIGRDLTNFTLSNNLPNEPFTFTFENFDIIYIPEIYGSALIKLP